MSTQTAARPRIAPAPFSLIRLAALALAAAAANAVVFAIGRAAGATMTVSTPGYQDISLLLVVLATALPLAIGGLLTWSIARAWPRFHVIALWLGLALALASVASPFFVAGDAATGFSLAAMHLVAAAGWLLALRPRRAR